MTDEPIVGNQGALLREYAARGSPMRFVATHRRFDAIRSTSW
jgi:hypothetical protein